jgi:hypothetical protein
MRKIIFSLFTFLSVTSLCFAQQAQTPVSKPMVSQVANALVENKIITGKVDSVTIGDVIKGTKSELMVVAENGQKLSFVVKSGTPITDKEGKTVTLIDINKDSKVTVEYVTNQMGTHKAQSIKLVE